MCFKVSSGFFLACVDGGTRKDRQTLSKGWFSDMNMKENISFYFTAGKHGKLLHSSTWLNHKAEQSKVVMDFTLCRILYPLWNALRVMKRIIITKMFYSQLLSLIKFINIFLYVKTRPWDVFTLDHNSNSLIPISILIYFNYFNTFLVI